jgi:hypothetical protein
MRKHDYDGGDWIELAIKVILAVCAILVIGAIIIAAHFTLKFW